MPRGPCFASQAPAGRTAAGREVDEPVHHRRRAVDRAGRRTASACRRSPRRARRSCRRRCRRRPSSARRPPPCRRTCRRGAPRAGGRSLRRRRRPCRPCSRRTRGRRRRSAWRRSTRGRRSARTTARASAPCRSSRRARRRSRRRDEDEVSGARRSRDDLVVSGKGPLEQGTALAAKPVRVEVVVPGTEIEHLADEERRRLHGARTHPPELTPVPCVPGDDETLGGRRVLAARERVHVRLVDDPVRNRRRCRRAVREMLRPDDLSGARVDGVEPPLLLSDVDLAVGDRGREFDVGTRLQLPEPVVRRPQVAPVGCQVGPLDVVAVGRPLDLRELDARLLGRLRLLRLLAERVRELFRRRADDGPAASRARPSHRALPPRRARAPRLRAGATGRRRSGSVSARRQSPAPHRRRGGVRRSR